jgi:hypothetical protein
VKLIHFVPFLSISGELDEKVKNDGSPILKMDFYENNLEMFDIIHWSGNLDITKMKLARYENNKEIAALHFHG